MNIDDVVENIIQEFKSENNLFLNGQVVKHNIKQIVLKTCLEQAEDFGMIIYNCFNKFYKTNNGNSLFYVSGIGEKPLADRIVEMVQNSIYEEIKSMEDSLRNHK